MSPGPPVRIVWPSPSAPAQMLHKLPSRWFGVSDLPDRDGPAMGTNVNHSICELRKRGSTGPSFTSGELRDLSRVGQKPKPENRSLGVVHDRNLPEGIDGALGWNIPGEINEG